MSQKWQTAITQIEPDEVYLRGYPLGEMIGQLAFPAATYLLIRGRMPTPGEARMMDAILCSVLDYGLKKPGTIAARYCVSANPSIVAGLATAVLSVGSYTLSPDDAGAFIASTLAEAKQAADLDTAAEVLMTGLIARKYRVPGFGHPNFRFTDPRAQTLKKIAMECGCWGDACDWYESIHRAFIRQTNKPEMVINEVGMMAAILVQMGFEPAEMTGIAIMSSLPGAIAHISEELKGAIRIRTLPDEVIETNVERRELAAALVEAGWSQERRDQSAVNG
jgi:citrate synthase